MYTKKSIKFTLIFLILTLTIFLFSCAKDSQRNQNDTSSENTAAGEAAKSETTIITSNLPAVKLDRDFTIIYPNGYKDSTEPGLIAEQETGDAINDAIYKRNLEIDEKFGVKIKALEGANQNLGVDMRKYIQSGDDTIDLILPHSGDGIATLATSGLLYDWFDMEYVDFSKPWWNSSAAENFLVGGKLVYAAGDICPTGVVATLFNKNMMQELSLEDPYNYVFSGGWTFDKYSEFIKGAYRDLNGNGEADKEDVYGFVTTNSICYDMYFLWSGGLKIAQINKEGRPELSLFGERLSALAEKVYNLVYNQDAYYDYPDRHHSETHFINGRSLTGTCYVEAFGTLRSIEFDFGLLPLPKLDEAQENYCTFISAGLLAIPINIKEPENASIIIEALAESSYKYYRPAYFDVTLSNKCLRDDESWNIFKTIQENKNFDIGYTFAETKDLAFIIPNLIYGKKSTDVASYYEKYAAKVQKELDNAYDSVSN